MDARELGRRVRALRKQIDRWVARHGTRAGILGRPSSAEETVQELEALRARARRAERELGRRVPRKQSSSAEKALRDGLRMTARVTAKVRGLWKQERALRAEVDGLLEAAGSESLFLAEQKRVFLEKILLFLLIAALLEQAKRLLLEAYGLLLLAFDELMIASGAGRETLVGLRETIANAFRQARPVTPANPNNPLGWLGAGPPSHVEIPFALAEEIAAAWSSSGHIVDGMLRFEAEAEAHAAEARARVEEALALQTLAEALFPLIQDAQRGLEPPDGDGDGDF